MAGWGSTAGATLTARKQPGGQAGPVVEGGAQGGGLQFGAAAVFVGGAQPGCGAAYGITDEADQGFVAGDGAAGELDDRLVDRADAAAVDGRVQHGRPVEVLDGFGDHGHGGSQLGGRSRHPAGSAGRVGF
jgi:hypothetical protein